MFTDIEDFKAFFDPDNSAFGRTIQALVQQVHCLLNLFFRKDFAWIAGADGNPLNKMYVG
jgi:hypothetical protein